ncbi:MAG TPA: hypothetical protein VF342_17340 [Alphaproteobacteria bacterium]
MDDFDPQLTDDDIDLDRVITDPDYRRLVIRFLNAEAGRNDEALRRCSLTANAH